MSSAVPSRNSASCPIPEFGRSADGLTVARIGDAAYAMIPTTDGRHFLGSGWCLSKPLADWKRSDFYGHGGDLSNEAAFHAFVQQQAEHQGEKATLGRQEFRAPANTPWGSAQGAVRYGEGVVFHSASGHGGFHLTADRNAQVHPLLRNAGGWYEEDAAWAAVTTAWPDLFTGLERRQAEETLRHSWPDVWEAIHGRALTPGESRTRDGEAFSRDHARDWVVISAIYSDQHRGFTEVIATRGGRRNPRSEERRFLVPSGEYKVGPFGFVIDEARHAVYDGPSSFLGWRGRAGGDPPYGGCLVIGRASARGRGGRVFRDGFRGGRESPAARRGVIPMTAPISQTAFRGPGGNLIGGVFARLRLADRLPLRVSCRCRAHWDDPALDQLHFEREVDLGTRGDLAAAMTLARKAVASGLVDAGRDTVLSLVPQFVTILDAEHGLVLAGEVRANQMHWCAPVESDVEARRVVNEACGFRGKARAATDADDPASAAALLTRAQALEGRLVDPFWRDLAAAAVDLALAA